MTGDATPEPAEFDGIVNVPTLVDALARFATPSPHGGSRHVIARTRNGRRYSIDGVHVDEFGDPFLLIEFMA